MSATVLSAAVTPVPISVTRTMTSAASMASRACSRMKQENFAVGARLYAAGVDYVEFSARSTRTRRTAGRA